MNCHYRRLPFALVVGVIGLVLPCPFVQNEIAAADAPTEIDFQSGKQIFQHEWEPGIAATDSGDGIGPVFNAKSCVTCHSQGGVGGSGDLNGNVVILSIDVDDVKNVAEVKEAATSVHPSFVSRARILFNGFGPRLGRHDLKQLNTSVVLHRFGTDPDYRAFLDAFASVSTPLNARSELIQEQLTKEPIADLHLESKQRFWLTQRNSPALFGSGLIDTVSSSDLKAIAAKQAREKVVSGRTSGVFGWKGQARSLQEFVGGACANELGLHVHGFDQAMDPVNPAYEAGGVDLDQEQFKLLTHFVASLPAPKRLANRDMTKIQRKGETLFGKTGCSSCHMETVKAAAGDVVGIYSDLLLHDMGANLADPMQPGPTMSGGYAGGGAMFSSSEVPHGTLKPLTTAQKQEWRTPPLWGVRASAPYLHDGRAATLVDAILFHGGEAKRSVKRFLMMPPDDQSALIEFLSALKPPES